jgi:hypothetical protein
MMSAPGERHAVRAPKHGLTALWESAEMAETS